MGNNIEWLSKRRYSFFHSLDESFWEKILGSWENNVYLQLNTENKLLLILN